MSKILALLFSALLIAVPLQKESYLSKSWPKKMVEQSLKSTVIIFVSIEDGQYLGTGVAIKSDGTILTAAHVVGHKNADIQMVTSEGEQYKIHVLLVDSYRDLALVQPVASAQRFNFSKIQESDKLDIGQDVLVIGHPYGDFYTVTSGIISRLPYYWWTRCFVIETDAVVNPGNSGGPMFNEKGEVIGIISALKVDFSGRSLGIGIAISIREIHRFLRRYELSTNKPKQIKRHSMREFLYAELGTN